MLLGKLTSASRQGPKLLSHRCRGLLPPFHVCFDFEQVFEANAPGFTRGSLKHEAAKFGMKDRGGSPIPERAAVSHTGIDKLMSSVKPVLDLASLQIRYTTTLLDQVLILGKRL